jgi:DNA (cytosine-5)-methyltransferase 1
MEWQEVAVLVLFVLDVVLGIAIFFLEPIQAVQEKRTEMPRSKSHHTPDAIADTRTMPTAIELFCGAGGTSFGFASAGFDVRLGVDIDAAALATFAQNHPNAVALEASVEDRERVNGDALLELAGLDEVDVLIGGPSCQGYSTIGKRIEEDPRNQLFVEYIRLVGELRPRWILFENVRGMLFYSKGRFIKALREELEKLGYDVTWSVLNAADYGVPQRRQRLFLIGARDGVAPELPPPTHEDPRCKTCSRPDASNRVRGTGDLFTPCPTCDGTGLHPLDPEGPKPWVTVWDAIGDLPILGDEGGTKISVPYETEPSSDYQRLMRAGAEGYDLHIAKRASDYAYSILSQVAEGDGLRSIPFENLPERFKRMRTVSDGSLRRDCTTLYHRLSRQLPSYTITCYFTNPSSGAFVHPLANRALSIREAARLQSFPDRFLFEHKGVKRQIGNAVPPLLAEVIARHILEQMESVPGDIYPRLDPSPPAFTAEASL